ncbi:MAG: hypothetical protein MPEBLZ_00162 [Candidatus Methanoperedens nitroreducens]|uniref:Antitoxin SocA-like Panacea domain-containing protein n=1 Tax=Candidatus Methanoperedens nitratireducens TaxID=1392998 RepID=A0A0P7ZM12_9EURY|nr:hypothetical protein [Candidatus Methanoperedens sp. BLZ2]KAB2946306.1 MAG: hypothetical protein F9K14_08220 [Candidatus Methanoperedens sp.]KPQ45281.1 MAG: hypothetical protein MPEBLZ_00162 [Candidatus Methanoperedens sp. BLZ1]MBZ0176061.1 hypothetical protein [Candidatus Methanoperedens nitroreducens]CAG0988676.1 hypothetical protein METP2_02432 [Methanosarcinales archaeon]MCX9076790.1 hypothetical protein [Candidatus Methanoperedens sp.]
MTQKEVLCKVLDVIGLGKPNMSQFDRRIQYQKIIYLLQSSGISLGYGFNWYIKGPYSSPLAHVLYEIDDAVYEENKNLVFIDNERIVKELNDFRNKLGDDINNVNYLEVLASLHYINKANFSGKGRFPDLRRRLLEAKPVLNEIDNIESLIKKAYDHLSKFN